VEPRDPRTRLLQPQSRDQRDEPAAEALLSAASGRRPSLGYPGDKYEMGLEAIEEIEVIAAELAAEVFDASYAEIRVASGAMANLYAFMATCKPGDTIIAPPAAIGGHVTHHDAGCAGLYGLQHPARARGGGWLHGRHRRLARCPQERPKLITIGGSLNLDEHPVADSRHRRRGRCDAPLRRGASMRDHRRARVEEPAGRRRAPDDDEHLQEPRRTGGRADRHQ
jgi:glycine/serine hydroxymethyltransferase